MAVGISPTSLPVPRRHLCPFPLWPAFPTALVGRCSHEYYEHSVTIEVALRRPSCILSTIDVRARRRCRVRPRESGHSTPPAQWRVRVSAVLIPYPGSPATDVVGRERVLASLEAAVPAVWLSP